ncbi:hypothetical protein F5Y11DRAFT_167969 [Daldinia sp. FL1419]|nr:hypothetical protein F5Y11DRAFT_167969 [Daldinia sp. FL1419]
MSSTNITPERFDGPQLCSMPTELILKIMERLSPSSVTNLALSSWQLFFVFQTNKESILINVLRCQPEINILLYLYTSHKADLPTLALHPRIVNYAWEQFPVNLMGLSDASQDFPSMESRERRFEALKFTLTTQQVEEIWNMAKVVDWWVEKYPGLHWRDNSDDRRCLRDSEETRVRKAVARWWLYAHHHHGNTFARSSQLQPMKWVFDYRLIHIRYMRTSEIRELWHLWGLIRETVSRDLCSSPEDVYHCKVHRGYDIELVPWGTDEGRRHSRIVRTYMKLDPEQLRYFLTYFSNWKKSITIRSLLEIDEDFARDSESLSASLSKVLEERKIVRGLQSWTEMPQFGIVDEDRPNEVGHAEWLNDAWPGGRIPLSQQQIDALPQDHASALARGDNGHG